MLRIQMRLAQRKAPVSLIDGFFALLQGSQVAAGVWLASAIDAAAWAGHDFNDMVVGLAVADLGQQLAGIAQTGADCHLQFLAGDRDRRFLDAFQSANGDKVDFLDVSPVKMSFAVRRRLPERRRKRRR